MVRCYYVALFIASFIGLLSLATIITVVVIWLTIMKSFQDFAIVIDAGSTHTTIFLYTWSADKSDGLGTTSRISQVKTCDVSSGAISSIDISVEGSVKQYFNACMTDLISEITPGRKGRTLIFLGATGGLRLINMTNASYISSLLNSTRNYFSTLGLLFRDPENQVRIISGSEEGLSGWISTNILMRQLFENNKPLETYGVLDMGGASTQISFIAPNATNEHSIMNLFNTSYDVYSHAYLCYGQDQTRLIYQGQLVQQANGAVLIPDPCLQPGYSENITYNELFSSPCVTSRYRAPSSFTSKMNITFRGTGNYARCRSLMRQRFDKSSCSSSSCSFDGVYQPVPISSSLKFIAMSGFYSVFDTLAPNISLAPDSNNNYNLASTNLTQIYAAVEKICKQTWTNLINPEKTYRPLLCFYSMYHWTLFEYGYSMTDDNFKNFQMVKMIDSHEIGWTLGYMINQTNSLDPQYRPTRLLTKAEFTKLMISFSVILAVCIAIIVLSIILQKRRERLGYEFFR